MHLYIVTGAAWWCIPLIPFSYPAEQTTGGYRRERGCTAPRTLLPLVYGCLVIFLQLDLYLSARFCCIFFTCACSYVRVPGDGIAWLCSPLRRQHCWLVAHGEYVLPRMFEHPVDKRTGISPSPWTLAAFSRIGMPLAFVFLLPSTCLLLWNALLFRLLFSFHTVCLLIPSHTCVALIFNVYCPCSCVTSNMNRKSSHCRKTTRVNDKTALYGFPYGRGRDSRDDCMAAYSLRVPPRFLLLQPFLP